MSLRALVQDVVSGAFPALGDLPESVIYSSKPTSTVNPTTGQVTVASLNYAVSLVLVKYRREEIDGESVRPEDMKGLLPAKDLGFTPGLNDTITRNGKVWAVQRIALDPAESLYTLQLRLPS